jgi:hypothetical protein
MVDASHEYHRRLRLTADISNAIFYLLEDLGLSEGISPETALESPWGVAVLDAYERTTRYEHEGVFPRIPDLVDPGYPATMPVVWNMKAGENLLKLLREMRGHKADIDVSGGVEGFMRSTEAFIVGHINGDAGDQVVAGARHLLPLVLDWHDIDGAGEFGAYLRLPRNLVTHHTIQQAHMMQIKAAIERLRPEDVDEALLHDLRVVETVFEEQTQDLGEYLFDQYSLSGLHTPRVQDGVFDESRSHRVYVARLSLNASQMNDVDPNGELGSFIFDVMKVWFEGRKGMMRSFVQSSEKTTFQFIVEHPEDVGRVFLDFKRSFSKALLAEFAKRYPDRTHLDERAALLLKNITSFQVRGTAAVLPFDYMNLMDFAIQEPRDVEVFYGILQRAGVPEDALKLARESGFDEDSFKRLKPWLKRVHIDVPRMKAWLNEGLDDGKRDRERVQLFQAFVLQGVYYFLRHLSSVVEYFEKERASTDAVATYKASDLPEPGSDAYERLQAHVANNKYVSDGKYDPSDQYPDLMDERLLSHLPHLRVLLKRLPIAHVRGASPHVARILKVWERLTHEWGFATSAPRKGYAGGAKERLEASFAALAAAAESGNRGAVASALDELKARMHEF